MKVSESSTGASKLCNNPFDTVKGQKEDLHNGGKNRSARQMELVRKPYLHCNYATGFPVLWSSSECALSSMVAGAM